MDLLKEKAGRDETALSSLRLRLMDLICGLFYEEDCIVQL